MSRSIVCLLIIVLAACVAADPYYAWIEAESFGAWTQVKNPECSGGSFVAGNVNSAFCGDYQPLPEEGKFRAWVRYCEAQVGSRRGHVTVSTGGPDTPVGQDSIASPILGGKGGGAWVWHDLGEFEGDHAVVQLTGIEAWPAEVFFDCLLITSDLEYTPPDVLPDSGRFDHEAWYPDWLPRVALLYMDYEYAGYTPRDEWDADLNELGWLFDKFEVTQAENLWDRLGDYDILLMAALTTALDDSFMVSGADRLRPWLEAGGLLIYTDANYPEHIGWLDEVGLGGLKVETGGTGRSGSWRLRGANGEHLIGGAGIHKTGEDRPFVYCRHQKPGFRPVVWRWLLPESRGWSELAKSRAGAKGLVHHVGNGMVVATCLFKGMRCGGEALQHVHLASRRLAGKASISNFHCGGGEVSGALVQETTSRCTFVDAGPHGVAIAETTDSLLRCRSGLVPGRHRYSLYLYGQNDRVPALRVAGTWHREPIVQFADWSQDWHFAESELICYLWSELCDVYGRVEGTVSLYEARQSEGVWEPVGQALRQGEWGGFATDGCARIELSIADLEPGQYIVRAQGKTHFSAYIKSLYVLPDRLLPSSRPPLDWAPQLVDITKRLAIGPIRPERPPAVAFDVSGLSIDRKHFFPLGFFAVHKDSLPILAANGFNATCGGGGQEYLDTAWENGLRVFGSCSWDLDKLRWNTSRFREHPALMGYYVMDEPSNSGHTIAQLREMNKIIEDRDPMRPKFFIDNDPLEFPSCIPEVDIIMLDPYCIAGPKASLNRIVRDMNYARDISRRTDRGEKPVFVVLQAHPYGGEALTMPTPEQIRAETYLAITEGARGVFYFLFEEIDGLDGIHNPDGTFEEPQWQEMKRIAKELPGLHDALHAKHVPLETSDERVRASLRDCGKETVIFAVNQTAEEFAAEVKMTDPDAEPLKLHFEPYGVHVIREHL